MKVKDVMMGTPYYCQPETNLGSATELMWNANCGFLPVEAADGKVIGVITDRDICIALGTRNRLAGDIAVGEVMSGKLYSCAPDDDIHMALQTMKEGKVRRLPVIAKKDLSWVLFRWTTYSCRRNLRAWESSQSCPVMRL